MANKLQRVSSAMFYNKPLLLSEETAFLYNEYLQDRNLLGKIETSVIDPSKENKKLGATYYEKQKLGVMTVSGSLTNKPSFDFCDGQTASYQGIQQYIVDLIDKGAKTIVLEANSGGGEAYRMMETSNQIRKLADEQNVKLIGYVDGVAYSAMYGLLSSFHEIIVNPDAQVGSVGVLIALTNNLKGKIEKGEVKFITSGKGKIPFSEEGEFRKEFIDGLQERTDELYNQFTSHVSGYRGIKLDKLKEVGADSFSAKKAMELKLVDSIKTYEEYKDYVFSLYTEQKNEQGVEMSNIVDNAIKLKEMEVELKSKEEALSQLTSQLESYESEKVSMTEQLSKLKQENSELSSKLDEVKEQKEKTEIEQRKEKLKSIVGESKLEETFNLSKSMDGSAFDSFVSLLSSTSTNVTFGKEVGNSDSSASVDEQNEDELDFASIIGKQG